MARKPKRGAVSDQAGQKMAAQLDALYAELPKLDCKGKCWKSCGLLVISPGERERVRREGGVDIPLAPAKRPKVMRTCPALKDLRCSVHPVRPMMCRLWGIADWMRCPHGCKPEGGWMTERETVQFFLRTHLIAGWPEELEHERLTPKEIQQRLRQIEAEFRADPPLRVDPEPEPPAGGSRRSLLRRWRHSE